MPQSSNVTAASQAPVTQPDAHSATLLQLPLHCCSQLGLQSTENQAHLMLRNSRSNRRGSAASELGSCCMKGKAQWPRSRCCVCFGRVCVIVCVY